MKSNVGMSYLQNLWWGISSDNSTHGCYIVTHGFRRLCVTKVRYLGMTRATSNYTRKCSLAKNNVSLWTIEQTNEQTFEINKLWDQDLFNKMCNLLRHVTEYIILKDGWEDNVVFPAKRSTWLHIHFFKVCSFGKQLRFAIVSVLL